MIILAINILLLIIAWRLMFKPAIRGYIRDCLFDHRDSLRDAYAIDGTVDEKTYKYLRSVYNGHIRFIEEHSLIKNICIGAKLHNSPKLAKHLNKKITKRIENCGAENREFIEQHRNRANRLLKIYMIHSSFIMMTAFWSVICTAILCAALQALIKLHLPFYSNLKTVYIGKIDKQFNNDATRIFPESSIQIA